VSTAKEAQQNVSHAYFAELVATSGLQGVDWLLVYTVVWKESTISTEEVAYYYRRSCRPSGCGIWGSQVSETGLRALRVRMVVISSVLLPSLAY